jgi:hypothetical protein
MKTLATLSAVIMGAALLSAAPFSLRLSPERIVSLSLDTAAAQRGIGRIPKANDLGCRWVRGVRVC